MQRIFRPLTALVLVLAIGIAAIPESATAQKGPKKAPSKEDRLRMRRGGTVSAQVAKKLLAAQELIQANKPEQAIRELEAIKDRRNTSPIELATADYFWGFAANAQEKQEEAIEHFTKAIQARVLNLSQELNTEYMVAQLYMMQEDFEMSMRILKSWFKKVLREDSPVKPSGAHYYTLALCYMQLEDIKRATRPAEIAVKVSKNPQEQWLRLLGQLYYMQGRYADLATTVEYLIVNWPKPEYYKMLSGAYAESGEELKSLAVLQLAYTQGMSKSESEIRHLAQSYLFHEIPYQAAQVLALGIERELVPETPKNLSLLGDAWLMAREPDNAFEPLEKAASKTGDAEAYAKLAQAYIGREKWEEADAALGNALQRGIKDAGNHHLLQGLARMNLRRWSAAEASFAAASGYDNARSSAEAYKNFLKTRKEQWEALN